MKMYTLVNISLMFGKMVFAGAVVVILKFPYF